jgi:hypothetical protein
MTKFLAFDVETCSFPEDKNWKAVAPLGISCIGLMGTGWDEPLIYYAGMGNSSPEPRAMDKAELEMCVRFILAATKDHTIVGWNSLQFDLNCIYEELKAFNSILADEVKLLAMNHVDPMFQIFCTFGWPIGLDAVAHGLGLPGKMKDGVSGADAPEMWLSGTDKAREKVLEYVGKDAIATLDIVEVGVRTQNLRWNSKTGRPYSMNFTKPKTVTECLDLPTKDNSWMDKPLYRKDFYSWTQE